MKRIYSLAKSENVSNIILGLIFLFPILPFNFVSILVIVLAIALTLEKLFSKESITKKICKNVIYSSLFYFLFAITLVYSDNLSDGLKEVQKSLPILLFPLIFWLKKKLSPFYLKTYLLIFIFANVFFIIFLYRYFLTNFFLGCHYEMSLLPFYIKLQYLFDKPFYELMWCSEKANESKMFIHKVYNSMYFLFCNVSIIYLFKKFKIENWLKSLLVSFFILFSLMIINMVSVLNLFLLVVLLLILFISIIKKQNKYYLKLGFSLIILFILAVFYIKKDSISFITKEFSWISNEEETINIRAVNAADILESRYYVNTCSIDIIKQNPIFGIGVGDVQDYQNKCYQEKAKNIEIYKEIYQSKLNSHNQYFTYLISGGFSLLIAFLAMLLHNLKREYLRKNYLFISFIILIMSNLIFESMFIRMYGVLFFSLFASLLSKQFYKEYTK